MSDNHTTARRAGANVSVAVEGLDHPEGLTVLANSELCAGGEAGQIYPIDLDAHGASVSALLGNERASAALMLVEGYPIDGEADSEFIDRMLSRADKPAHFT